MKIDLILLGMILSASQAYAGKQSAIYIPNVVGSVSERTWYSKSHCNKIDDTKKLISILKTESQELGYSHCKISELVVDARRTLKRQCDQKAGTAEFFSPVEYCKSLLRK